MKAKERMWGQVDGRGDGRGANLRGIRGARARKICAPRIPTSQKMPRTARQESANRHGWQKRKDQQSAIMGTEVEGVCLGLA